jgi:hypothetical protein
LVTPVLLLVAIALVLIGVVTLIVGIFSDTLVWVFVSIGSTVLAGVVLYVLYRLGRRQVAHAGSESLAGRATVFSTEPSGIPGVQTTLSVPLPSSAPPAAAVPDTEPDVEPAEEQEPAMAQFAPAGGQDGDGPFPIADYDDLRVAEILPLLSELDADELDRVREREGGGKGRATILARIDELAVPGAVVSTVAVPAEVDAEFPIADYDELRVAEILPLLSELDADELEVVADREERGANRQTILSRVDTLLETIDSAALVAQSSAAPPAAAVSPSKAPARKAGAAKASAASTKATTRATKAGGAKRAGAAAAAAKAAPAEGPSAKRSAAAKRTATATKAAPAKRTATKATATKATATKATATKATAKKATAKKTTAKKTTAKKAGGR